ncbi:Eco57I restriction-modification methylase domain-containing protein [Sodaliphilus sp.]|uniref:Eco57I restriction-modification methylase domain-containing protein n=1 Tax=Sodaliphilus sp. TaxID=2815818 RepID=UPI00388D1C82
MRYESSLKSKLIYVFRINDKAHEHCVKIGEATLNEMPSLDAQPNCKELNQAAKRRINQYTQTAGIAYDLLHTELTFYIHGGVLKSFNDKEVHDVLRRSGVKRHSFATDKQGTEWFECDLNTVLEAIKAVKAGHSALNGAQITHDKNPIKFRPEQKEAISKTVKKFAHDGAHMLWNAKMRFGKTLSSLQVVKECKFHRTLIFTHRPVVDAGWFDDFNKIFLEGGKVFRYGSKNNGFTFQELEADAQRNPAWHYIYFASMQDLRGSKEVGGKFDKNDDIFNAHWDCLIIDEAHEGTRTELGKNVIESLTREHTRTLNLSGTPFNMLDDFNEDEVYTWDYVMEQEAKQRWELEHFGDPNPYAGLPRLNIFTFDLGKMVGEYADVEDRAFNFKEFFRTWTGDPGRDHVDMPNASLEGRFVHESDVKHFLDLIVKYDPESNYPYSTIEYRKNFRHSLWMLPGVKEARALSALLQQHKVFSQFNIINVAGDGDEEAESDEALKMVENAMGKKPEDTYTITLSCGRLTTGVTVRPWTAVFMLAGSAQTDAKAYMQTIFRVQSPYQTPSGKRKEECFVFDFAPDRTLKVIAKVAHVTATKGKIQSSDDKAVMGRFLNFCPIIGYNGTRMDRLDVNGMLEQLKRVYVDRVVKQGFEDSHLYNDNLLKLNDVELKLFADLKREIGSTSANHNTSDVDINKQGLTDEQYEQVVKASRKKKKELTEEEKQLLEELKEKKKNRSNAISILRGISIRFPLLIYGAELTNEDDEVTIDNFAQLIDDQSWSEFMPKGVTKERFAQFVKYYDPDIFRAAGRQIRDMARAADTLAPTERVKRISAIFSCFRNPDKETVLTPWRVVNMHISDTLGGWDFYDETHDEAHGKLEKPRHVVRDEVTERVFSDPDTRILEINSKTGLYPLYVAYSVFAERCRRYREEHMLATDLADATQIELWDKTLAENIFVICKTPMAKSITRRTLRGFRQVKVNARYFEDLINQIKNKPDQFIARISNGKTYWKANDIHQMKFNAIVGNPPYQIVNANDNQNRNTPIYHLFVNIAINLPTNYVSMVIPARWYFPNILLGDFTHKFVSDTRLSYLHDFPNATNIFQNVEIKSGVCYFLWDKNHDGMCNIDMTINDITTQSKRYIKSRFDDGFIRYNQAIPILEKVHTNDFISFSQIVSPQNPFGFNTAIKGCKEKNSDSVIIISKGKEGLDERYINRSSVSLHTEWIDQIKILTSKAAEDGMLPGKVIAKLYVIGKGMCCNGTYLLIGPFGDNTTICQNTLAYLKTKFLRFLVGIKKPTQDLKDKSFTLVPLQDFSENSDIDWSVSVAEIDRQLYRKYHLSEDEVEYIESMIKPME